MAQPQFISASASKCASIKRQYDDHQHVPVLSFLAVAQDTVREIASGMSAVELLYIYNFLVTARVNFARSDEEAREAKRVMPSVLYDEAIEVIALEVARKVPVSSRSAFKDPITGKRLRSQVMRAKLYQRSQRFPAAAIAFA